MTLETTIYKTIAPHLLALSHWTSNTITPTNICLFSVVGKVSISIHSQNKILCSSHVCLSAPAPICSNQQSWKYDICVDTLIFILFLTHYNTNSIHLHPSSTQNIVQISRHRVWKRDRNISNGLHDAFCCLLTLWHQTWCTTKNTKAYLSVLWQWERFSGFSCFQNNLHIPSNLGGKGVLGAFNHITWSLSDDRV